MRRKTANKSKKVALAKVEDVKATKPVSNTKPVVKKEPKKIAPKPVQPVEKKYNVNMLKRTLEFLDYEDLITALFDSDTLVTKTEVKKALQKHLEREV